MLLFAWMVLPARSCVRVRFFQNSRPQTGEASGEAFSLDDPGRSFEAGHLL